MTRFVAQNEGISLADIISGLFKRKVLIVSLPLLALVLAELFLMASKPAYLAESQVIIENLATPFDKSSTALENSNPESLVNDRMVQSQVSVLKSGDIVARVVDQLSLDRKPEYNVRLQGPGTIGQLAVVLGFRDDPTLFGPKELAAKTLSAKTTVYPIPETNVIGIKSVSTDANLAESTANAIAETYVLSTHEVGFNSNDRARGWLSKQVEDLRAKVAQADAAVEKYRADAGLLKGATTTLGTQQISELNSQITIAQTARGDAEARANQIRLMLKAGGPIDASADVLASTLVQNLKAQQAVAQGKLSQLSATYLPNHPKMIAAQKELFTINGQVREAALHVVESLQSQAKIAEQRAVDLRLQLDQMKGSEADANQSDVKLKALEREADANRAFLQTMLARYADASSRQDTSLQPGFARIIQKAVVPPAPYFPKPGPTLFLAGLAGLFLALGLGFVLEVLAQPVQPVMASAQAHERRHVMASSEGKPFLVPDLDLRAANAVLEASRGEVRQSKAPPKSLFGSIIVPESLNAATTVLNHPSNDGDNTPDDGLAQVSDGLEALKRTKGVSCFAVTNLGGGDFTAAYGAIATGRQLAARQHKIVLLDASATGGAVEKMLGLGAGPGLSDLVAGSADFTKVVCRDPGSTLHVIRAGFGVTGGQRDVIAERLPAIIAALKTVYGMVIVHVGEARASTVKLLALADAAVILAMPAKLQDASMAALALEESSGTSTLLVQFDAVQPKASRRAASA